VRVRVRARVRVGVRVRVRVGVRVGVRVRVRVRVGVRVRARSPTVKGVLPSLMIDEARPKVSRRRRPELVSVDALTLSAG
jgi:hypothetical protein